MALTWEEIAEARIVEIRRLRNLCLSKSRITSQCCERLNKLAVDENAPQNVKDEILAIAKELEDIIDLMN